MANTFKDKRGREWAVPDLTLLDIVELKKHDIDIHEALESGYFWEDLDGEAWVLIGRMCWILCQGQHDIDEEAFYRSWDGDVFIAAQEATREAVLNFIPTDRRTVLLNRMQIVKETAKLLPMLNDSARERINSILSENASEGLAKLALPTLTATAYDSSPGLHPDDGSSSEVSEPT